MLPPIDLLTLPKSILVSSLSVNHHARTREKLNQYAGEIFKWITVGSLKVTIGERYALKDAAQAHKDILSRKTVGKLLLIP